MYLGGSVLYTPWAVTETQISIDRFPLRQVLSNWPSGLPELDHWSSAFSQRSFFEVLLAQSVPSHYCSTFGLKMVMHGTSLLGLMLACSICAN